MAGFHPGLCGFHPFGIVSGFHPGLWGLHSFGIVSGFHRGLLGLHPFGICYGIASLRFGWSIICVDLLCFGGLNLF